MKDLHFSSLERRKTKQKEVQDFSMQLVINANAFIARHATRLDGKGNIILQADTKSKLFAPSR